MSPQEDKTEEGASKRRQVIAPAVRPGLIMAAGTSAKGAAHKICAGPSDLHPRPPTNPALTGMPALRASFLIACVDFAALSLASRRGVSTIPNGDTKWTRAGRPRKGGDRSCAGDARA